MPIYSLDGVTPDLAESCWCAPDASVIGKIVAAERTSIWFGAVLRGDNEAIVLGEGTNVQEHSVLHTDMGFPLTIGAYCTIGHRAIMHGCTIGDNTLVGMGATVMNGAVVGENCIIAAGALISEGKQIPDNSLVIGAPGKVVRTLDAQAAQGLRAAAESYVANAARFRDGLKVQ